MSQVVIDQNLRSKLLESPTPELVDETGKAIGYFVPYESPHWNSALVPPISPEERERIKAEPGVFTTEELLAHLRSL